MEPLGTVLNDDAFRQTSHLVFLRVNSDLWDDVLELHFSFELADDRHCMRIPFGDQRTTRHGLAFEHLQTCAVRHPVMIALLAGILFDKYFCVAANDDMLPFAILQQAHAVVPENSVVNGDDLRPLYDAASRA